LGSLDWPAKVPFEYPQLPSASLAAGAVIDRKPEPTFTGTSLGLELHFRHVRANAFVAAPVAVELVLAPQLEP